jgi:hypothetical protein
VRGGRARRNFLAGIALLASRDVSRRQLRTVTYRLDEEMPLEIQEE